MGCISTSLTQVLTSLPLKPSVARPNAWRAKHHNGAAAGTVRQAATPTHKLTRHETHSRLAEHRPGLSGTTARQPLFLNQVPPPPTWKSASVRLLGVSPRCILNMVARACASGSGM